MKNQLLSRSIIWIFLSVSFTGFTSYAQVPFPDQWETFVSDPGKNILVRDIFLSQTFENRETDNWEYTPRNFRLFNASEEGIQNQTGLYSYELLPGSEITFSTFNSTWYDYLYIKASFAGNKLGIDEALIIETQFEGRNPESHIWAVAQYPDYSIHYSEPSIVDGSKKTNPIQIGGKPMNLKLKVSDLHTSGYYCLDHVFAFTDLPSYSLFTGKGNWEDEFLWTHLPAYRNRNALIQGEITLSAAIHCRESWLHQSLLTIRDQAALTCRELHLYDSEISIQTEGKLVVEDQMHVYKTFDEKGKWYFISFPFDVYMDGIDKDFEVKDDQPNAGGNFLYILFYDGIKRSMQNHSTGNWEIISTMNGNQPIFEKGKGYLIAIDEKATKNTLVFSSVTGDYSSGYFKTHSVFLDFPEKTATHETGHYGWYLCGNPFLGSLSLKQLENYPELEPYIYIYDGSEYQIHPVEEDPVIPPAGSFFIKAKQAVRIQFQDATTVPVNRSVNKMIAANSTVTKPILYHMPSGHSGNALSEYSIQGNQLYIRNMPGSGTVSMYDITGKKVVTYPLSSGDHTLHIPLPKGLYLLQLSSGTYQTQHKFIITQ